jgi:hypothetical protein
MNTNTNTNLIDNLIHFINKYHINIYNRFHKHLNDSIYPLFNFKNILKFYINVNYFIPDIYMKNLIKISSDINNLWKEVTDLYNKNNHLFNKNIENNNDINLSNNDKTELILFYKQIKIYNKKSIILINNIIHICKYIKEENENIQHNPTIQTNNNLPLNIEWFTTLIQKYLFYNGTFPTTTLHFINFFKYNWNKISNSDTNILYYIFIDILGGTSIQYNAYCLEDWIKKNIDIIKDKQNWIFT